MSTILPRHAVRASFAKTPEGKFYRVDAYDEGRLYYRDENTGEEYNTFLSELKGWELYELTPIALV